MKLDDITPILSNNRWTHLAYEMFIDDYNDQFIISEQQFLREGDLLSHPRNLVVALLIKQFKHIIDIYPITIDPNNILIHIDVDNDVDVDRLFQFTKSMGWYVSDIQVGIRSVDLHQGIELLHKKEYEQAIITIESVKTTTDLKNIGDVKGIGEDVPKWLYHATPTQIWKSKISKVGLAPKSKSTRSDHPSRIYVTNSSKLAELLIPDLAKQRIKQAKTKTYDPSRFNPVKYYKDWVILQIDTTKIPNVRGLEYITLFTDPNVPNIKGSGLYTMNYIPPDAITMIKLIKL